MRYLTQQQIYDLNARYIPNGDVFPLWGFEGKSGWLVTRGRTSEEAWENMQHAFPRGETVIASTHLPIDCNKLYDQNHRPGWLTRPPVWLLRRMFGV